MTRSPSVVVVGAGALGLCTAWHLTDRGVTDVTVIERDHVAGASSGLSVGIIETQYLDPLAIAIRVESMRFFTELSARAHWPSPATATCDSDTAVPTWRRSRGAPRCSGRSA